MDAINYYQNNKPQYSMAYKFGMLILDFFGIPTTILGVAYNWGDLKGFVLMFLSLLFLCVRFVFYVDDKLAARKTRRMDAEMKQIELEEKKHRNNKKKSNENY